MTNTTLKQSIKRLIPPLYTVPSLSNPTFIQVRCNRLRYAQIFGSGAFSSRFEVDFPIDTAIYTCLRDDPAAGVSEIKRP